MSRLSSINLKGWIDEHRHLLKPPVGNALVWKDTEFQIMIVGGPNRRNDYHIDPGEEFFHQIEGDMVLRVIEEGVPRDITIREGEMLLLPPLVPHSPQRVADTIGMVVERVRAPEEKDTFRWYCEKCNAILHDVALHVTDLGTQIKPVLETFYADEKLRTCRQCGTTMLPPAAARAG
ncbi:MAG: 3-hydroxyanthranilate 3,4-dioxygenase [Acidobacteria bacterium]|nr:3-hydroxyanthranilate 3,4-dioxygenase [Acidobacteriota bacterium]